MSLISSHVPGGAAAAERKGRAPKDEGESSALNMKEGTRIFAKFRDGLERKASVIERKAIKREDGGPTGKFRCASSRRRDRESRFVGTDN